MAKICGFTWLNWPFWALKTGKNVKLCAFDKWKIMYIVLTTKSFVEK